MDYSLLLAIEKNPRHKSVKRKIEERYRKISYQTNERKYTVSGVGAGVADPKKMTSDASTMNYQFYRSETENNHNVTQNQNTNDKLFE